MAVWGLVGMPTLSHALASARQNNGQWMEICSAQGTRRVPAESSPADLGGPLQQQLSHCPLCLLSASGLAPGPQGLPVLPMAGPALPPGALARAEPRRAPLGHDARPRGPPGVA